MNETVNLGGIPPVDGSMTKLIFAPMINSIQRKTGIILEQNDQGILLYEPQGEVLMVYHPDFRQMVSWLEKHLADYPEAMVLSIGNQAGPFLKEHLPLSSFSACRQYVWTRPSAPTKDSAPIEDRLILIPARKKDLPEIAARYRLADMKELEYALCHHNLFLLAPTCKEVVSSGFKDPISSEQKSQNSQKPEKSGPDMKDQHESVKPGTIIGFIGEHSEGSMGFLEIYPEYRRKGYALEAERKFIELELGKGRLPYCHVFDDNQASMALQHKIGLEKSPVEVEWLWQTSFAKESRKEKN